jgi:hypothetical protein
MVQRRSIHLIYVCFYRKGICPVVLYGGEMPCHGAASYDHPVCYFPAHSTTLHRYAVIAPRYVSTGSGNSRREREVNR